MPENRPRGHTAIPRGKSGQRTAGDTHRVHGATARPYRKGELEPVDYGGGFGRQVVAVRPDPRSLPQVAAARSYTSVASAWLL